MFGKRVTDIKAKQGVYLSVWSPELDIVEGFHESIGWMGSLCNIQWMGSVKTDNHT